MNEGDIADAIVEAYFDAQKKGWDGMNGEVVGQCKRGFEIRMQVKDGDIETAYPLLPKK